MGTAFAYGSGTTINELEQRKDAVNRLFDVFSEKRQKKFVAEWRKNYPQLEWDDALTIMFISEGPEVMLADIINEGLADIFISRVIIFVVRLNRSQNDFLRTEAHKVALILAGLGYKNAAVVECLRSRCIETTCSP